MICYQVSHISHERNKFGKCVTGAVGGRKNWKTLPLLNEPVVIDMHALWPTQVHNHTRKRNSWIIWWSSWGFVQRKLNSSCKCPSDLKIQVWNWIEADSRTSRRLNWTQKYYYATLINGASNLKVRFPSFGSTTGLSCGEQEYDDDLLFLASRTLQRGARAGLKHWFADSGLKFTHFLSLLEYNPPTYFAT